MAFASSRTRPDGRTMAWMACAGGGYFTADIARCTASSIATTSSYRIGYDSRVCGPCVSVRRAPATTFRIWGCVRTWSGILLARDHRLRDRAARHAHDVGDHRAQLDVCQLQDPSHPVDLRVPVRTSAFRKPGQIAQIADLRRRHEAALEQSALEKLCDPLAIPNVRRPAGHVLDVPGVDQQQPEAGLEHRVHRAPAGTRPSIN